MSDWRDVMHELVAHRYDDLVAYARVVAGSHADAEDLVHEALVATFGKPRGLNDAVVAEAYVRRAIATRFIDGARKRGREARTNAEMVHHTSETTAGADHHVVESTDLRAALDHLTPRERACVALRFLEQMSVRETATTLGLADGSVKRYVSDGIAKLNVLLGTSEPDDDPQTAQVLAKGGRR